MPSILSVRRERGAPGLRAVVCSPLARRGARAHLAVACSLALGLLQAAETAAGQDLPSPPESSPQQVDDESKLDAEVSSLPETVSFDTTMLEQRGIDPTLAQALSTAPRFSAGAQQVSLRVNAAPRGHHAVRFDPQGRPCVDASFIDAAGLVSPPALAGMAKDDCLAFQDAFPAAYVEPEVETLTLGLVVPTEALREPERAPLGFVTGGTAALLNYELTQSDNRFDGNTSTYRALNAELGLNAGEWILRSRQVWTQQDGRSDTAHLETFAQRSILDHRAVLRAGQINLVNPILAGVQMTGVQVASEGGFAESGATVEGIAHSQARVEVRQQGSLIYATVVPAGPFVLSGIQLLNPHADLEVTVMEADGTPRQYTVPSALYGATRSPLGYVFGVGQARNLGDAIEQPWVASAGWSGPLRNWGTLTTGILAAKGYGAVGGGLAVPLPSMRANLQGQIMLSRASDEGVQGVQARLAWVQALAGAWSMTVSSTQQSSGYRELVDATLTLSEAELRTRYRRQESAGLSWASAALGAFSMGYSRTTPFDGSSSQRAIASWSKTWRRVTLSANAERNLSSEQPEETRFYLNASIPLGENRRARVRVRDDGRRQQTGLGWDETVSPTLSYRVNADRDSDTGQTDWSASASWLPHYAQADFNYSRYGSGSVSMSGTLRGGVLWHRDGLTLSPYPMGESFAVLSVGDDAGVQVTTPSGPVWTDAGGRAVIARLSPYTPNPVEVVTKSLPANAELQAGSAMLEVGRGAVDYLNFPITTTRRVLLTATDEAGQPLAAGASVSDENGQFVGLGQSNGQIFLDNHIEGRRLWVQRPGLPRCELVYSLPEKADLEAMYETAPAVCRSEQE